MYFYFLIFLERNVNKPKKKLNFVVTGAKDTLRVVEMLCSDRLARQTTSSPSLKTQTAAYDVDKAVNALVQVSLDLAHG